jgi:hypothetical protein
MMKYCLLLIALLLVFALPAAAQDDITYATAQRYEHGLMIWRADTGDIWALANDGRAFGFPSPTYANLPDNPIFGTPPDRLRPIFGMGKVWGNFQYVRDALGWPTLDELGFNMPVRTTGGTAYFTQLDGTVIQINGSGTWQRTLGDRPAPYVLEFRAVPEVVAAGESVTLNWQVQGTTRVQIELYQANGSRIQQQIVDNLPLTGSTTFTIPARYTAGARFVLWGVDRAEPGGSWVRKVSAELIVATRVNPGPVTSQAAYQPFERGFMLWRADTDDVQVYSSGGQVLFFGEDGYAGWPDPAYTPAPINAFGKVWNAVEQVRGLLGNPTAPEQAYTMTIRNFPDGASSFMLPDGRTATTSFGTWRFAQP